MHTKKVKRLTVSAMMIALATVLALVCAMIPFLNLPFGGSFTVASMLPIVIISYMYGIRWGLLSSLVYAVIQVLLDLMLGVGGSTVMALFMPSSDGFMGYGTAIWILLLDYLIAYTVLGLGGIFRNRIKSKALALCLGTVFALSLRYLVHIASGYAFYGSWAEWFFGQENFTLGHQILNSVDGKMLALIYSVVYNGLYMIPEIVITAIAATVVARLPQIRKIEAD